MFRFEDQVTQPTDTFPTTRLARHWRLLRPSKVGTLLLLSLAACWTEPLERDVYGSCERLNEEGEFEDCGPVANADGSYDSTDDEASNLSNISDALYDLETRQVYPEPATTVTGSVRFGVNEFSGLIVSDVHFASQGHRVTNVTLRRGGMGDPNSFQLRFFDRDPSAPDVWNLVDQGPLSKDEVHAWTRGNLFVSVETSQEEVLRAQLVPSGVELMVIDVTSKSVSAHHHTPQDGTARAFLTVNDTTGDSSIFVHTLGIEPTAVQLRQGSIGDVWGEGPEIHVTYRPQGWSTLWSSPNYSLSEDWILAMQYGRAYVVLYTDEYPPLDGVGALRGLIDLAQ